MSGALPGQDGNAAATPVLYRAAADMPTSKGAYLLVIELARPCGVALPGKTRAILDPGIYLYCGSARGPGGLKARVGRHLRRGKSVRWHVDRLTRAGRAVGAFVFPDGSECDLVARLRHLSAPVPGFGSSDCRVCRSHLLHWTPPAGRPWTAADIAAQLH